MLTVIPALAFVAFGVFYPLYFFTQYGDRIGGGFYRFQLGLSTLVGGLGAVAVAFLDVTPPTKALAAVWLVAQLGVTAGYWKREGVNEWVVGVVSIPGLALLLWAQSQLVSTEMVAWVAALLGGAILAGSFFCMNLGHWYLNVRALSTRHLRKATRAFGALLLLRLVWDLGWMTTERVPYEGYYISLWRFCTKADGLFLGVAVVSGTILPLVLIFFVLNTLKIRATESATGLLYVAILLVLMGELSYRYYHVTYALML